MKPRSTYRAQEGRRRVEFGNTLLLAENSLGVILDWELFRDSAPADSALLPAHGGPDGGSLWPKLKALAADGASTVSLTGWSAGGGHLQCRVSSQSPTAQGAERLLEVQTTTAASGANRRARGHLEECFFGPADAQQRLCAPRIDGDLDGAGP